MEASKHTSKLTSKDNSRIAMLRRLAQRDAEYDAAFPNHPGRVTVCNGIHTCHEKIYQSAILGRFR